MVLSLLQAGSRGGAGFLPTHLGVVPPTLQVHKMLAEFRLIPGLNNLFDKLIWRKFTASNHVVHGQNENCDCSPVRPSVSTVWWVWEAEACPAPHSLLRLQEISFKIQFLRLLQSFSDHHE